MIELIGSCEQSCKPFLQQFQIEKTDRQFKVHVEAMRGIKEMTKTQDLVQSMSIWGYALVSKDSFSAQHNIKWLTHPTEWVSES
jgi:hypothetical protein